MTPENVLALSSLFTAIIAGFVMLLNSSIHVRRDEISRLADRVKTLECEKAELQKKYDSLFEEHCKHELLIAQLRTEIIKLSN
jgi:predicted nuclease with TOPRIM domain